MTATESVFSECKEDWHQSKARLYQVEDPTAPLVDKA